MLFEKKLEIKGMNKTFEISPKCKRYTLRDNGFEETKAGNFQLSRTLDVVGLPAKFKMKLTISKNLETLKLSITNMTGLTAVDLYKMSKSERIIEKFEFIIDGLVDRDVLIEA